MAHVTFIHGIANKPDEDKLLAIWRNALKKGGLNLGTQGVSTSMVYWADVLYDSPDTSNSHESNSETTIPNELIENESWVQLLNGQEKEFVLSLSNKLNYNQKSPTGEDDFIAEEITDISTESIAFERIPIPWFIKRRLMKAWLKDVHHYLFNTEFTPRETTYRVQDEIRDRFLKAISEGNKSSGPHIVVSHSMGTVIAYDCLKRVSGCESVDGLMTIGSPLGLDEVQDMLQPDENNPVGWSRADGFPNKIKNWVNIYDKLDPVAGFDAKIANDYKKNGKNEIFDLNEQNEGKWRHSIHKYLVQPNLIAELKKMLDI